MLELYKNILVVAAHPDDEILGCGGAVRKLTKLGATVNVLILGEGKTSRGAVKAGELETLRDETKKANKILGVTNVATLNLPDNKFDSIALLEIIKHIEEIKSKIKPDLVLTHHSGDINIDHKKTFEAVLTAFRPLPDEQTKAFWTFETPSSSEYNAYSKESIFVPNLFIDIADTIDDKIKALGEYKSEMREYPHPRSLKHIENLAKTTGARVGVEFAEAFCIVWSKSV